MFDSSDKPESVLSVAIRANGLTDALNMALRLVTADIDDLRSEVAQRAGPTAGQVDAAIACHHGLRAFLAESAELFGVEFLPT
jgi:hypothetical protein